MEIHCQYCDWVGQEPSTAEYDTQEAYEEAYQAFLDSHVCKEDNNGTV